MSSIFLSYSSTDAAAVTRLRDLLVSHGYPTVFQDRDEEAGIPGGTEWAAELFGALERSDIVVFMASKASLASPWCHTELAVAIARGKFVIQVAMEASTVHPLLTSRQRVPPEPDLEKLANKLILALTRAGFAPGDPFQWDPGRSPYPGLERLDEQHAAVLFGRDAELEACLARVRGPRPAPLLVTGPSGSGKSSLIRAGVLPRLAAQPATSATVVVEPGSAPIDRITLALRAALAPGAEPPDRVDDQANGDVARAVDRLVAARGSRVVLFLDQAEDLLERTSPADLAEVVRRLDAVDPERLLVIAAVRSATLDDWLREPALGPLGRTDPIWIRPMDRAGLRDVILGPAHVAGIRFEPPELVERILDDTGTGNALPLLAALLGELTAEHTRIKPAVVTAGQYEAIGPVARVLERRAESAETEISARLGVTPANVVDAFLRLAQVDDQGRVTAAEVALDDLPQTDRDVLLGLQQHRLVTVDRRIVTREGTGPATPLEPAAATAPPADAPGPATRSTDVASPVHEAVFRSWPAVAGAIQTKRADLETRTWLIRDARTWDESGRGQAALTGGRLNVARDWSERNPDEVTPAIRAYVGAAVRQVWRRRVLTVAVPVLAIVVLVVGALGIRALSEADRATREAGRANAARSEANALRLVSDARTAFRNRPDLGYLLAMEAAQRSSDARIQAAPLIGLAAGPGPRRYEDVGFAIDRADLDDQGRHAILAGPTELTLWDVDRGIADGRIERAGSAVAISGDGNRVAYDDGGAIRVAGWPSDAIGSPCRIANGPDEVQLLAMDRDGGTVAVAWEDEGAQGSIHVAVLDPADCSLTRLPDRARLLGMDLDAGGERLALAVGEESGVPVLWDAVRGIPFEDSPTDGLSAVRFGGSGQLIGVTPTGDLTIQGGDGPVISASDQIPASADGSAGVAIAVSPDGSSVAVVSASGQLRVVHPSERALGEPLLALPPLDVSIRSPLAAATDGGRTVTVDPSGRLIVWDLDGAAPLGPTLPAAGDARLLWPLADGSVLAATEDTISRIVPDGSIASSIKTDPIAALGGDGSRWAVATTGGRILVADPAGTMTPLERPGADQPVALTAIADGGWAVATPGGIELLRPSGPVTLPIKGTPNVLAAIDRWLYVGAMDGSIHVIDTASPQPVVRSLPRVHSGDVSSMTVSPDGKTLATGSDDRTIALWSVAPDGSLTERARLRGNEERIGSIAFSPDGRWLASGSDDEVVRLFDLASGAQVGDPIPVPTLPKLAWAATADRQLDVAADGLHRWDMRLEKWPSIACGIIGSRRLDDAERATFLNGEAPASVCP